MRDFILVSRDLFVAKVGRCATCMRQSLAAALAMWGIFGIGLLMWPDALVQDLIGLSAIGLTALWILHVATYAVRAVVEARNRHMLPPRRDISSNVLLRTKLSVDRVDRRRAFGVLLRAAGAGVVASVPLLWPSVALAFCGQCTRNADCGVGWVCRNTAPVNSGKVCNECVKS